MLATMGIAETIAAAEAIAAAAAAAEAAALASTATTAATAAGALGATEAATAALTAGELGSAASGIASLPAGITPEVATAMQQGATIGGQGAAAGMPPAGLEQLMASGPPPGAGLEQANFATRGLSPPPMREIGMSIPQNGGIVAPSSPVPSTFYGPPPSAPPPPMPAAPSPAFTPEFVPYSQTPGPNLTVGQGGGAQSPGFLERIFGNSPAPAPAAAPAGPNLGPDVMYGANPTQTAFGSNLGPDVMLSSSNTTAPTSSFMRGVDSVLKYADANPIRTGVALYTGANALGLLNPNYSNFNNAPYDGPLSKYKLSPDFKSRNVDPGQYRYTPRYAEGGIMQMAQGGVTGSGNLTLNVPLDLSGGQNGGQSTPNFAFGGENSGANTGFFGQNSNQVNQSSMAQQNNTAPINVGGPADTSQTQNFARGGSTGNLSSTLDYYTKMMEGETPKVPSQHSADVGIYHDTDPDTRSLDPYSAARTRLAKTKKRAYVSTPPLPAPTPMGQLNFSPPGGKPDTTQYQEAAKGGIMGVSNLGGYAAGGNPRLLKGPGDGMSDNIPATINGRQPARLADGEFVIPADVVSHLGNGSTEAGAKVLHQMMTKVRRERTGNPKQGKQINPRKYMPQ